MSDYTTDSNSEIDDFCLPNVRTIDRSAEKIKSDNEFKSIPAGEHVVMIKAIPFKPTEEFFKVQLDGAPGGYHGTSIAVEFCLPDDKMSTVTAYFRSWPSNEAELPAYFYGIAKTKDGDLVGKPGGDASQFYQFLGAIGYSYTPGELPPADCLLLRNWIGRKVKVVVQGGTGTYVDKKTLEEKPSKSKIRWFSYSPVEGGAAQAKGVSPRPAAAARPAPQPAAARAVAMATAGDDVI